jgi:hypothetical protein
MRQGGVECSRSPAVPAEYSSIASIYAIAIQLVPNSAVDIMTAFHVEIKPV